jgi:hypothetical protein
VTEPTKEQKQLKLMAAIGQQLDDFARTDAFLWLLDQAHDMKERALIKLAAVNPRDVSSIIAAQRDAQVADRFEEWIKQGIQVGVNAMEELDQQARPTPD